MKRFLPNKRKAIALAAAAMLAVAVVTVVIAQSGGGFELTFSTENQGAGASTGESFSLSDTIGQAGAGNMSGGVFSLQGGFQSVLIPPPTPTPPPPEPISRLVQIANESPREAGARLCTQANVRVQIAVDELFHARDFDSHATTIAFANMTEICSEVAGKVLADVAQRSVEFSGDLLGTTAKLSCGDDIGRALASSGERNPAATAAALIKVSEEDTASAGCALSFATKINAKASGATLAAAARLDPETARNLLLNVAKADVDDAGNLLANAAQSDAEAIGEVLANNAETDAETTGAMLARAAEIDAVATGAALVNAARADAESTGVALAKASVINPESIGAGLVSAAQLDPEAVGQLLVQAAREDSDAVGDALAVATALTNEARSDTTASGVLTSTDVAPESLLAKSVGTVAVSFTISSPLPAGSSVVVSFPSGFGLSSGAATGITGEEADFRRAKVSVSGQSVTIARSRNSPTLNAGSTIRLKLTNIENPGESGSTGSYSIRTTDASGIIIEEDTTVQADTITPETLTATFVEPQSLVSGALGNVDVGFTTLNPLPVNGRIVVTFPSGFQLSSGGPTGIGDGGVSFDGAVAVTVEGQSVILVRSAGTPVAPGSKITLELTNIKNPTASGAAGAYAIKTTQDPS